MNRIVTKATVLRRTNFGEADRIATVLTSSLGKVRIIAKGSRKAKSKLAGGIELFGVSDVTLLEGRGEIKTLLSARSIKSYTNILKEIDRTMLGYKVLKIINKITEDAAGKDYFDLLIKTLESLDDEKLSNDVIWVWFSLHLLQISGHAPNLTTDRNKKPLVPNKFYGFDLDDMTFFLEKGGAYSDKHIKILRLATGLNSAQTLNNINGAKQIIRECSELVGSMWNNLGTYLLLNNL